MMGPLYQTTLFIPVDLVPLPLGIAVSLVSRPQWHCVLYHIRLNSWTVCNDFKLHCTESKCSQTTYLVIKCSETWESSKVAKARYFEPGATQAAFDECRISSGTAFNEDEIYGKRIPKCYYQFYGYKITFSEYLPEIIAKKRQIFLAPFGRTEKFRQWFYIKILRLLKNITLLTRHYTERPDTAVGSVVSSWC